jgi:hypothetical protein
MKGTNKKKAIKKSKAKGGASKRNKRSALHSGNATYNAWMAQKAHRLPAGLPGTARGKHIPKDASCECGKCSNERIEADHA